MELPCVPRQEGLMASIADTALPLLPLFAPAFTPATFRRVHLLVVAAILTPGRRTVSNVLRTVGHLAVGAPSSYHRVLSQAHWSGLRRAALLTRFLDRLLLAGGHDPVGRRRHRQRAPRQKGLRQGPAPRPRAQQPHLHRPPLRPQVGGPVCPGPLPLCQPALGPARAGGPV